MRCAAAVRLLMLLQLHMQGAEASSVVRMAAAAWACMKLEPASRCLYVRARLGGPGRGGGGGRRRWQPAEAAAVQRAHHIADMVTVKNAHVWPHLPRRCQAAAVQVRGDAEKHRSSTRDSHLGEKQPAEHRTSTSCSSRPGRATRRRRRSLQTPNYQSSAATAASLTAAKQSRKAVTRTA